MSARLDARLLVVEDNDALRRGIVLALRERYSHVDEARDGDIAIGRLRDSSLRSYDVVLSDVRMPGSDGFAVLAAARQRDSGTSVLLITAYGSIDAAVNAMREGAFDFVQKPIDLDQLELRVARVLEHRRLLGGVHSLRAEGAGHPALDGIVGRTPRLDWPNA